MNAINMFGSSRRPGADVVAGAPLASMTRLRRAWAVARGRLEAIGVSVRLLELNDHLLKDAGLNRADIEYEAMLWGFGRFDPDRERVTIGSRRDLRAERS